MSTDILTWLLEQSVIAVVMGIVIFWLQKKLAKVEDQRDQLSKEVIKLTVLWESKANELGEDDKEFKAKVLEMLTKINICVSYKNNNSDV